MCIIIFKGGFYMRKNSNCKVMCRNQERGTMQFYLLVGAEEFYLFFYTVLFQEDLSGILRRKAAGRYFPQQSGHAPAEDSGANHSDATVSGSGTRHAVAGENQTESSEKTEEIYRHCCTVCSLNYRSERCLQQYFMNVVYFFVFASFL